MLQYNNSIKNNARLTSDNVEVILISRTSESTQSEFNLTTQYGMTAFSWNSKDEIKILKPVTRLEPIACVQQNGFDLEFSFAKENYDDLMQLLLFQHQAYYNGDLFEEGLGKAKLIGINRETTIQEKPDFNNTQDSSGEYSTNTYNTPIYDIVVNIKHFSLVSDILRAESFKFKNVTLYQPSQRIDENSGFIMESFKGFASYVDEINSPMQGNNFDIQVESNIENYTKINPNGEYVRRTVIDLNKINNESQINTNTPN